MLRNTVARAAVRQGSRRVSVCPAGHRQLRFAGGEVPPPPPPQSYDPGDNPHVLIDLCVVPLKHTDGASVSREVAVVERLIRASGLKTHLHSYGTNIEGPWDEVMDVVKRCHTELHKTGIPRVTTSMRMGTRMDKHSSIEAKIQSLEEKL